MKIKEMELISAQASTVDTTALLPSYVNKRSWTERTFGPMNPGSIRGSIFTLVCTALGAGYLSVPNILLEIGIVLGLGMIIGCGFIIYFSLMIIAKCAYKYKIYHYPSVAREMLGYRWAILLELAIICNGYGLIVALNIISGSLIPEILSSIGVHWENNLGRTLIMIILNVVVVTPLSIMRNLGALRFKALFNVTCLTFIVIIVTCQFPFFWGENDHNQANYTSLDSGFFTAFSLGLFAYLCHQNVTTIQGELYNGTMKRMRKVVRRSVVIMCVLLCTIALFGYLSCLDNTPALIILRKPPSSIENDTAMILCKILITITTSIGIPINLNPCRKCIQKLFFNTEGHAPDWMHYGITLSIVVSTLLLAIFFPNIKIFFHFLGGFCGSIMALIIPGLMYVRLSELPILYWKNLLVLIGCCLFTLSGFTSIALDIYRLF